MNEKYCVEARPVGHNKFKDESIWFTWTECPTERGMKIAVGSLRKINPGYEFRPMIMKEGE